MLRIASLVLHILPRITVGCFIRFSNLWIERKAAQERFSEEISGCDYSSLVLRPETCFSNFTARSRKLQRTDGTQQAWINSRNSSNISTQSKYRQPIFCVTRIFLRIRRSVRANDEILLFHGCGLQFSRSIRVAFVCIPLQMNRAQDCGNFAVAYSKTLRAHVRFCVQNFLRGLCGPYFELGTRSQALRRKRGQKMRQKTPTTFWLIWTNAGIELLNPPQASKLQVFHSIEALAC